MIYKFKVAYTTDGVGTAPSVAPVCTVVDANDNVLASAQATTALANMTGVYLYSYTGTAGLDLVALFHTTDTTVDSQDLYSYTSDLITTNIDAKISDTQTLGVGATAKTYTVTDGVNPIADVDVWVTSDIAGAVVVASGKSDSSGEVVFYLDSGVTYYIWRQKDGYNFTNPDTEVA